MIRRPPGSTLFPTRRSSDLFGGESRLHPRQRDARRSLAAPAEARHAISPHATRPVANAAFRHPARFQRSEEHTSELQSQSNLVCRLLLEKKKNNTTNINSAN